MKQNSSLILIGTGLVIFSALGGAIADRLFVIKPLDALVKRTQIGLDLTPDSEETTRHIFNEESSIIDVAESAAGSVVTVSVKQERLVGSGFSDPFSRFGGQPQSGRSETVEQDIGTGFVVEGGSVVSNKHVVSDPTAEYKVIDRSGEEYQVTDIYRDPINDLAILRIESATQLTPVELGESDELKVGQSVIAIGTALGEFRHTVTTGVISGLGRGIEAGAPFGSSAEQIDNVIQTDAAINPGNSGGPLLNSHGQVIGINTAVSSQGQNIGFALPINVLKASLDNFQETGEFDRAFLGVSYQTIPRDTALLNDVPSGALVRQVVEGSSAQKAGLLVGDIITKLDGRSVADDEKTLAEIINKKRVGQNLKIEYWRDGESKSVDIKLSNQ